MNTPDSNKTDSSLTSDLLNSTKKRLGSNFWLSLLGVFIYQKYTYLLHIFYSNKEQYCYDYMKHLTDYYIIKGITWSVFAGYALRALGISLAIYILSLAFNFLKKFFNGYVDTRNDYLTKKKEEAYKVQLITDRTEFKLKREKGVLETLQEKNAVDKANNQKDDERLRQLSNHLKKHETSINNKDERITNWSKEIETKELKLIEEQRQLKMQKLAQNERTIKLDAQESDLTQRLQEIEEQKINLEKYELPKLTNIVNASLHIKQFILDYKDEILNGEIIEAPRIPTTLQNFLTPKDMLINTGDNYLVVSHKGKDIFKKLYDSLGK